MTRTISLLLLLLLTFAAGAGTRKLTRDDIYDSTKRIQSAAPTQSGFTWFDDTHFFWPQTDAAGDVVAELLVDATTGAQTALFNSDELQAQVSKLQAISSDEAKTAARPKSLTIDWGSRAILLSLNDDLFIYSLGPKTLKRLTSAAGAEDEATFSPDGKTVAFIRGNNLFTIDVASRTEKQLTSDGSDDILNGKLDWLYQEEIYGRGTYKGYWWSPDSRTLAYLKLDVKNVPPFTTVDHILPHQKLEVERYPKPGDPNPLPSLFAADLSSGESVRLDRGYEATNILIVDVAWKPDSFAVDFQVQDREQTWLDLVEADRAGTSSRRILRETTKAWVDIQGSPFWMGGGSFLWLSERTGWKHIYRVTADGQQRPVTSGEWEVRKLFGFDAKSGWIYFSAAERSPIGVDVYRIRADGSRMQRVSKRAGTHDATFNKSLTLMVENWSDLTTPPHTIVVDAKGKILRDFTPDAGRDLDEFDLSRPELVQVLTRDGFPMEAILIKPTSFDPTKRYPVYQFTYGGPHAPSVKNAWGGNEYLFHQLLAQNGIVVWICDNRTASGKGAVSAWPLYRNMGELELRDVEDGLDWLTAKPWVDSSRVMIDGWSYGGYMVTYALTHSERFKAGIAGGPVTSWRDYDSVYTERYMLTPEHNAAGYERTAPYTAARKLHGSLLLLHGLTDDNVHIQNTIKFAYELQQADIPFQMMVYPKSRHGVIQPELVKHLRATMLEFIFRNLLPESGSVLYSGILNSSPRKVLNAHASYCTDAHHRRRIHRLLDDES